MKLESSTFIHNGNIPREYTCYGRGLRPMLTISDVLPGAKSLAIIVDDPDAPSGDFVHWVIWNIDPHTTIIEPSAILAGTEGYTSLNKSGFVPPCPPSGIHHYNFKLYALDTILSMPKSSTKADLIRAMNPHIIGTAMLTGLYGK